MRTPLAIAAFFGTIKHMNENPFDILNKDPIKEMDEVLRKAFSGWIKQSFLLNMRRDVFNHLRFVYYLNSIYTLFNFSYERELVRENEPNFEVCQLIAMFHFHNTFLCDERELGKLQSNTEYRKQLCEDVVDALLVRRYGANKLSPRSIIGYYPPIYYANAQACLLSDILNGKISDLAKQSTLEGNLFIQTFAKILTKSIACIVLLNECLIEEAFNPLRSMVELLTIYFAVSGHPKAIEMQTLFSNAQSEYNVSGKMPEQIKGIMRENGIDESKTNFLNYGWLKYVPNCPNKKFLSFKDVCRTIVAKTSDGFMAGDVLYNIFDNCSPYSHAHHGGLNHFACTHFISSGLLYILDITANIFAERFNCNYVINDVNIQEKCSKVYIESYNYSSKVVDSKNAQKFNEMFINPAAKK